MAAPSSTSKTDPTKKPPTYITSSGNVLATPPLSARISRLSDDVYNFLGLYFVSLFSMDPYTAAQNSQFNTRNSGPNAYQNRSRWSGGVNRTGGTGGTTGGGGEFGSWGSGGGGGGGGSGGGGSGGGNAGPRRNIGTVDDVRGPECGSCG